MTAAPYNFDDSIRVAQRQIDTETIAHQKRMEFWKGYKAAMEEVRDHWQGASL